MSNFWSTWKAIPDKEESYKTEESYKISGEDVVCVIVSDTNRLVWSKHRILLDRRDNLTKVGCGQILENLEWKSKKPAINLYSGKGNIADFEYKNEMIKIMFKNVWGLNVATYANYLSYIPSRIVVHTPHSSRAPSENQAYVPTYANILCINA